VQHAGRLRRGGVYADGSTTAQAFVANETNGKWGDAIEVPGSSSINIGGAVLYSISCHRTESAAAPVSTPTPW